MTQDDLGGYLELLRFTQDFMFLLRITQESGQGGCTQDTQITQITQITQSTYLTCSFVPALVDVDDSDPADDNDPSVQDDTILNGFDQHVPPSPQAPPAVLAPPPPLDILDFLHRTSSYDLQSVFQLAETLPSVPALKWATSQ